MKILINNNLVDIIDAKTFLERFLGLMGKKNIKLGLLLKNCNSIHTFFMKESIDVVMLNEKYQIISLYENLQKNKIIIKKGIKYIIELPKKSITLYNIKLHQIIDFIK